jgi:hypothetical protein
MKTHNLEYGVVLKECEDGTVHITFNRRNLKAVNEVVFLASVFLEPFGHEASNKAFSGYVTQPVWLRYYRNVGLMAEYIRRGCPSPEKFAEEGRRREQSPEG